MKPKLKVKIERTDTRSEYYPDGYSIDGIILESLSLLCPHCGVYASITIDKFIERDSWKFDIIGSCVHCEKTVFVQSEYVYDKGEMEIISIYPQKLPPVIPQEIDTAYHDDYRQAMLICELSPKASAALSRRILQMVLHKEYQINDTNLYEALKKFKQKIDIPSYIKINIDAVRHIGNMAVHPIENSVGTIIDIDTGDADWLLLILEDLFEFTFIRPKQSAQKQIALNQKTKPSQK